MSEKELSKSFFMRLKAARDKVRFGKERKSMVLNPKEREMAELQFAGGDSSSGSQTVHKGAKVGRNDPCPCGSGKKYKKCCGQKY